MAKSKLKMALNAEKGVDVRKVKMKRAMKQRQRAKAKREEGARRRDAEEGEENDSGVDVEDGDGGVDLEVEGGDDDDDDGDAGEEVEEDDEGNDDEEIAAQLNLEAIDDSDSDSSSSENEDAEEEDEEEEEDDIPMSDLDSLPSTDAEDLIPHQKLTVNNKSALLTCLKRISLPLKSWPFSEHQSITTSAPVSITDVSDDLNRELAFYAQALSAVQEARKLLKEEGVPFSRPNDYFAEMVKADEHMEKIKAKLVSEAAGKKAAAEARKQRDLKKFGKQVQIAKLQERQKEKRETLEKIKVMKRKRQEGSGPVGDREADLFDVALEDEISKPDSRSRRSGGGDKSSFQNSKRQKKDQKFGFGGKKRFSKSGDAVSSGDLSGFSARKMKGRTGGGFGGGGAKQRPGKARRAAGRR